MIGWFIWNKMRSDSMGLWVSELPPIIRPEERNEKVEIPGRAGSLIVRQGEDVYKSYIKECRVMCRRDMELQNVLDWLRGDGVAVFGNEPERTYKASILSEVRFEKVSNDLIQAVIPFYVEPFKMSRYPEDDSISISDVSETIYNPGDVASKPVVTITTETAQTLIISFAGRMMTFQNVSGTIVVDCDAEIITQNNSIWQGTFTGSFWKIPKGECAVAIVGTASIVIEPNWRWV